MIQLLPDGTISHDLASQDVSDWLDEHDRVLEITLLDRSNPVVTKRQTVKGADIYEEEF